MVSVLLRNVRQVWLGGRPAPRQRWRRIERLLTAMPSLSSSPLIRSVLHNLFSRDMLMMRSRTSRLRCGRPPREPDFQRQNRAQPCRCQRTTVSGVTNIRCSRQPAQKRRATTHNSLSQGHIPAVWSESGESGRQLMAQEQVLKREVVARARPGQHGREQQPEEFKHPFSMPDRQPSEVVPSRTPSPPCVGSTRSMLHLGASTGTASIVAATAMPTVPCG